MGVGPGGGGRGPDVSTDRLATITERPSSALDSRRRAPDISKRLVVIFVFATGGPRLLGWLQGKT